MRKALTDPLDFHLHPGALFFWEEGKYQEYLAEVVEETEVSTCSGFKAGGVFKASKFKNVTVSGIFSCMCARHGSFRPDATVDLQKGEKFINCDYAVAGSLKFAGSTPRVVHSYNVNCQYCQKMAARFAKCFLDVDLSIVKSVIPKWHVSAHREDCQYEFSFYYTPGMGNTDGEAPERNWAVLNPMAPSTREMNTAHRHESLEDHMNNINYHNMLSAARKLVIAFFDTTTNTADRVSEFQQLKESYSPEIVAQWEKLDQKPTCRGRNVSSVFKLDTTMAPTLPQLAKRALDKANALRGAKRVHATDLVDFILEGIELETMRANLCRIRDGQTSDLDGSPATALRDAMTAFADRLEAWLPTHAVFMPRAPLHSSKSSSRGPESFRYFLPSSYSSHQQKLHDLSALGHMERKYQQAQARDALDELRIAIKHRAFRIRGKYSHKAPRGQKAHTRMQGYIDTLNAQVKKYAAEYSRARQALLNLGMSPNSPTFQPLSDSDLKGSAPKEGEGWEVSGLGESHCELSWIWTAPCNEGDVESWSKAADKVQFFRSWARRDRAVEEINKPADLYGFGHNALCVRSRNMYLRLLDTITSGMADLVKEG
ncbi:hypothetical protein BOTBODRAFT_181522 [Botryobasidium botryosum FD-172 SS1]|uniref:Uncharacterized protein n=1 Tax=Botryobasidium botryosum (strain FD-172 SS1) TaxID=930990 RepID=A0A067LTB4_BOTB1|nr:hypothetical protein BOTBODRAFT_181522 [Botryobasidium botryosum FD-172 SS1]